jgi:hypothetical protein
MGLTLVLPLGEDPWSADYGYVKNINPAACASENAYIRFRMVATATMGSIFVARCICEWEKL